MAAITSGLAPACFAVTEIVGKSTRGNDATGKILKANKPSNTNPILSKVVATGRRIKGVEILILHPPQT